MLLTIDGLCSGYGRNSVLRGIRIDVDRNEIVALVGANGAGKSTLLNTIMGAVRATAGSIRIDDAEIQRSSTTEIVRHRIAIVPERRQLFASMTVEENLLLGAFRLEGHDRRRSIAATLREMYTMFPILRERQRQKAGLLSGGEQQMLAIGRALMSAPRLLLLDESSLGLAPTIVSRILSHIAELGERGLAILLVEQNAKAALSIAKRAYVLETGEIKLEGPASELLEDAQLSAAYLGEDGERDGGMEARLRRYAQRISGDTGRQIAR
ncbi:MAG: ABC transporter ATP-binding protein [Lautropia sp.]